MRETSYNSNKVIDHWNRDVKPRVPLRSSYCAKSVCAGLEETRAVYPKVRSGMARAFVTSESVSATDVWRGRAEIPYNSLAVFTRRGGGHIEWFIGIIRDWIAQLFGANTSKPGGGSDWNGVYTGYTKRDLKKLCSPYAAFRITHFTPVIYEKQ